MALAVVVSAIAFIRAEYNFDAFAYAGCAATTPNAHAEVYTEARAVLTPDRFADLIKGAYRQAVYADAEAFRQTLGWYRQRVLFTWATRLLHSAGVPLVRSVQFVSAASYCLLIALVAFWLTPLTRWGAFVAPLLCLAYWDVARLGTPDTLYALIFIAALYALLERTRAGWCCALLAVSLFARNDGLFLALAVLVYAVIESRISVCTAVGVGAILAAIAMGLSRIGGHYGAVALIYNSFVEHLRYPETFHGAIAPAKYAAIWLKGAESIPESRLCLPIILALLARPSHLRLPICLALAMMAHYMVYPQLVARQTLPFCVALVIISVKSAADSGREMVSARASAD